MSPEELEKFGFLLGNWRLVYHIPLSDFSPARSENGTGTFKKILNDKYVLFEYSTESGGEAKGIFTWDNKLKAFRYWWFENSGSFATATCNFINDEILAMNWHDTLLIQTFVKENPEKVVLKMQYPSTNGGYSLVMEVIFTRMNYEKPAIKRF